jgi:hypothetical protein
LPEKKASPSLRLLSYLPLLCVFTLIVPTQAASAQASAYGAVGFENFCTNSSSQTSCKSDTVGLIGGGFYNFPIQSRVTVGIDGRVSYGPGTRGGTSATAAMRVGFVPNRNPLRPYFQLGGGVVTSAGHDPRQANRHTSGALQLAFGLDLRLTNSIDWRVAELGGAAGAGSAANPAAGTAYFNTGIVYHFGRRKS